jgi:hypothetical protein
MPFSCGNIAGRKRKTYLASLQSISSPELISFLPSFHFIYYPQQKTDLSSFVVLLSFAEDLSPQFSATDHRTLPGQGYREQ